MRLRALRLGSLRIFESCAYFLLWRSLHRRKNFVFRGSFEGAERACVLWSLMMSCRVNGVNPREYLLATLEALRTATRAELATLTPRAYAERKKAIEVARAA